MQSTLVATAALKSIAVDGAVAVNKTGNTVLKTVLRLAVDLSTGGVSLGVLGATSDTVEVVGTEATVLVAGGNVVVDDASLKLVREVGLELLLSRLVVHGVAGVGSIDESLKTLTVARVALHELLVLAQSSGELLLADVVDERAGAEGVGDSSAELAVAGLEDGLGGLLEDVLVEVVVVHGQTTTGEESVDALHLLLGEQAVNVGQGRRVGHVDGDGVTVTEGNGRGKLVKRRPSVRIMLVVVVKVVKMDRHLRVTVGNDTVETDLVKVRGLELEHLVDTSPVDLVGSLLDLLLGTIGVAESGVDELLSIFVEKIKCGQVSTAGDLDQLCETVPDLRSGKSAEETKVKEGVDRSVVCTETVLVVGIVDTDLDGDGSVDQANDGGGDTDEVGVAAVGSTCKSGKWLALFLTLQRAPIGHISQSALKSSFAVKS
jgi:hypothetical protein